MCFDLQLNNMCVGLYMLFKHLKLIFTVYNRLKIGT